MKLSYIFLISWRNLMERKVRSLITISGVIIGITLIVFLTSLGYGVEKLTTDQIASEDSLSVFDVIVDESDIMLINDEDIARVRNIENVLQAEPGVKMAGKVSSGLIKTDVIIKGYSAKYNSLTQVNILKGRMYNAEEMSQIVVSSAVLKLMNIQNNNFADVTFEVEAVPDPIISPTLTETDIINLGKLNTVGVIDDDSSPYILVPFDMIQKKVSITSYNELKVKVEGQLLIADTRTTIEKMGFPTSYMGDTIRQINSIFVIFRYIIGGFGLVAMFVAVLGMFNTLTVSLLERITEIGVLKANNAMKRDIFLIFLSEALIISFIGSVFGIISGILTGKMVNFWFNFYALKSGSNQLELFYLPPIFMVEVIVSVTLIGFLTGLYPSRRATRIKILDALKYE